MANKSVFQRKQAVAGVFWNIGCVALCLIFLFPFLYMVFNSFAGDDMEILSIKPSLFPTTWQIKNYYDALIEMNFFRSLGNTLIILVPVVILNMTGSLLAAYGFARHEAKGKNFLFTILIGTMMLPWVVTMVPGFILFKTIGWTGTLLPLIIPAFGGSAYNIFMMRQFIMTIPRELDDAARIDGCSEFGILFRVLMPNMKPVLTTLFIFLFTAMWSDYIGPSIYILKDEQETLSLALLTFQTGYNTSWKLTLAGSVLFTAPVVIMLFSMQKYFVGNSMDSAFKG